MHINRTFPDSSFQQIKQAYYAYDVHAHAYSHSHGIATFVRPHKLTAPNNVISSHAYESETNPRIIIILLYFSNR